MKVKNRGRLEILADMIEVCTDQSVKKTWIMYRANISFDQLSFYLPMLLRSDLLKESCEFEYTPTQKGLVFLELRDTMVKMLDMLNVKPIPYSSKHFI